MFQDGLEEGITEAVVLAPGEAVFFWMTIAQRGVPLGNTRNVGFHLAGPGNWAGREAQVGMMVSTVQDVHWAIAYAVVEKKTIARQPGCPQETTKINQTPTVAHNIEQRMQGLEEDASKVEVSNSNKSNHGTEWRNAHSQHMGSGRRWYRWQGAP